MAIARLLWSVTRTADCCARCGTTERKHNAKGLCWRCYLETHGRVGRAISIDEA